MMEWVNKIASHKTKNYIYRNNGDLTFSKMDDEWGLGQPTFSNGAAYGDLDLDGDLDLVINNIDDRAFIYSNNTSDQKGNNYFRVRLTGAKEVLGLNAKVWVYADDNHQFQELTLTRGYQSSCEQVLHFGMGQEKSIDSVVVKWLTGSEQVIREVGLNETITVNEGDATMPAIRVRRSSDKPFRAVPDKAGIDFVHKENKFDDFEKEILLPHKQSQTGPFMGTGDVNGDGMDDIYIGGAMGQSGILYIQSLDGSFKRSRSQPWVNDKMCEDMGIAFFDSDRDDDIDIYIVSGGGGEIEEGSALLQDRLYINDGQGRFERSRDALPRMLTSGLAVEPYDYDNDGDEDLFVGGRLVPGNYPFTPRSYLLQNDNGKFTDITETNAPGLMSPGMITSALWTDFDADGTTDLILTGEWMPLRFFKNTSGKFTDVTAEVGTENTTGWWNDIVAGDFDEDGDIDYIAGNLGLNSKFKASIDIPFDIYCSDFDNTGTYDIVLATNYEGRYYPVRGKECSTEQMPFIGDKYPSFKSFASADINDIYGRDRLDQALHFRAKELRTCLLRNENGRFTLVPLPMEAQIAPLRSLIAKDVNGDGHMDVLGVGNMYGVEVETVRYDGGIGCYMEGNGKGEFRPVSVRESGFYVPGDTRHIIELNRNITGKSLLVVTTNNGAVQLYEINQVHPAL